MSTPTYELIETTTLSSSASSVTFTSITQDYRDLVLVIDEISDGIGGSFSGRFNNDDSNIYHQVLMFGDGTTDDSSTFSPRTSFVRFGLDADSGEKALNIIQIFDYSATDKHKSILVRANKNDEVHANAGRYGSTNAITEINIFNISADTGSTFSLYGIAS